MQNFICLPWSVVNEILPLAARRAWYLLAAHACHGSYPLAASRRFTNANSCRLSPASSRIFCAVNRTSATSASRSRRAFKARKSILHKIFASRRARLLPHCITLICREPSQPHISRPHLSRIRVTLSTSFSARALKFQPKKPYLAPRPSRNNLTACSATRAKFCVAVSFSIARSRLIGSFRMQKNAPMPRSLQPPAQGEIPPASAITGTP